MPFGRLFTYEPGLRVEGGRCTSCVLGPWALFVARAPRVAYDPRGRGECTLLQAQVQSARADSKGECRLGPRVHLSTGGWSPTGRPLGGSFPTANSLAVVRRLHDSSSSASLERGKTGRVPPLAFHSLFSYLVARTRRRRRQHDDVRRWGDEDDGDVDVWTMFRTATDVGDYDGDDGRLRG